MTYTGSEFTVGQLYRELKKRVVVEHIETINDYRNLIDELVMEKMKYGFFDQNEDLVQIRRDLELHWPEIRSSIDGINAVLK